jgi:hypothetical protein
MPMRGVLLLGLAAFWVIAALPASAGPEIPAAAINEQAKLLGKERVSYLLRQIDLTEEQATQAQGLIDSILPERTHPSPPDPEEVRRVWTELEKAKEAGNQEKVKALTKQLQQLGQDTTGDAEFFLNMESHLTDDQKKKLEQARARLERNPSGALRPVDLLQAARDFDLTEQQQRQLIEAFLATRNQLGPILRPSQDLKLRMINSLADAIRALLAPEQIANFEHRMRALRPDLVGRGLRVHVPEVLPEGVPTGEEAKPVGD